MGIQVLGPDVNESILKFSVDKNKNIRFGLGAVKGVGESAVQNIIEERKKNGPYKSIFDFVERVNLTACNKKNIESMLWPGAFDNFGIQREQFFTDSGKGELFLDTWFAMVTNTRWIRARQSTLYSVETLDRHR